MYNYSRNLDPFITLLENRRIIRINFTRRGGRNPPANPFAPDSSPRYRRSACSMSIGRVAVGCHGFGSPQAWSIRRASLKRQRACRSVWSKCKDCSKESLTQRAWSAFAQLNGSRPAPPRCDSGAIITCPGAPLKWNAELSTCHVEGYRILSCTLGFACGSRLKWIQ